MARSHKARYGTHCKFWKDTVLASRNQKKAWSSRKKIETRISRHRLKVALEKDIGLITSKEAHDIAREHDHLKLPVEDDLKDRLDELGELVVNGRRP